MIAVIFVVSLVTFVHYVGAQMRSPVIPLYAVAHGATATGVGLIVGAHMAVAAAASIPFGRASDVWGRRRLLLGGIVISGVTSLLLPLAEDEIALTAIYGLAGLGVAAFTPSALSLVGDAAAPGRVGHAYAWYSTAHYAAIGVGPFVGGLVAHWWGYRAVFLWSAVGVAVSLAMATALPGKSPAPVMATPGATFMMIRRNLGVWAGWVVAASGMLIQGVVFTFFPLVGQEKGLTPSAIGLVFLVLGLINTVARFPAGWVIDRTRRPAVAAVTGVLVASAVTWLLPHSSSQATLLAVVAIFGAATGVVGVATGVALATAATPAARGLVMGGYSTALYLGLALGSFALGPIVTHHGYAAGFAVGAMTAVVGAVAAAILWWTSGRRARSVQVLATSSSPAPTMRRSG